MFRKALLVGITLALLPITAWASALPDFPFVGVQGEAKVEVQPDFARISFTVLAYHEKSEEALETVKQRSAQVFELARSLKISDDAIISTGIDNEIKRQVNREHGYNRTHILGYDVSQTFSIKVEDLLVYSELIDKLITIGNMGNITPRFDVSNRKEIERSLFAEAGKDAKQKASDLANAMGVKVKSVFAINQDASYQHFFARFGLQELAPAGHSSGGVAYDLASNTSMNMMVPKTIEISKKISVVYKIR